MLCCIIPLAVAAIVTLVTGSTAAMFSGPMLFVTIGLTALSMGVMAFYSWKLFSKYILGTSDSCCETKEKPSCCHAKMKKAMDEKPCKTNSASNKGLSSGKDQPKAPIFDPFQKPSPPPVFDLTQDPAHRTFIKT